MKRLKKIGLTNAYRDEENTQVVSLVALPLVTVANIDLGLKDVTAIVTADSPSKTQLEQLCSYVHQQWLSKNSIAVSYTHLTLPTIYSV